MFNSLLPDQDDSLPALTSRPVHVPQRNHDVRDNIRSREGIHGHFRYQSPLVYRGPKRTRVKAQPIGNGQPSQTVFAITSEHLQDTVGGGGGAIFTAYLPSRLSTGCNGTH